MIALIVVIIFVICGIIFGSVVGFLVVNKIVKRHLYILEKKHTVEYEMVADLDDPVQMETAEQCTDDSREEPFVENDIRNNKENSKYIDDDF